jgi:phospholipase/carboxylesterase
MQRAMFRNGILQVTPPTPGGQETTAGLQTLQLDATRDALLYVPPSYTAQQPAPLAVMLHGAGGDAQHGMSLLRPVADAAGLIIVAPYARGGTWDIIEEERFGKDVIFISQALQHVINRYSVDFEKLAIGGFSDGASYALSLGLINGDLFTHILSFSPGFYYAPDTKGTPKVYVSHGIHDDILPIHHCSRRLVPKLRKQQYDVLYREFDGTHILPGAVREEAVNWFLTRN